MKDHATTIAERIALHSRGFILVMTGAGVSAASGLATFRGTDPGAIWSRDVTEIGTRAWFSERPVEWWLWFLDRFGDVLEARPNPAHRALAAIERWQIEHGGRFLLVTQNVDTLHEQAGSRELIKVHGSADRVRCSRYGCPLGSPVGSIPVADIDFRPLRAKPATENLPRCPECESIIRAHALLFDEYYDEHHDYEFARVREALETATLIVFIGTSFSVGVTDLATSTARSRRLPAISIDPMMTPPRGVDPFPESAETILPRVAVLLERTGHPAR